MEYLLLKWIHIVSATILFGTGIGIAFFKWKADKYQNLEGQWIVMRTAVLADWVFTAPAVVIQFVSGLYLANLAGYPLGSGWLLWSLILYFLAGACWLPVVWFQLQMKRMIKQSLDDGTPLPDLYHAYKTIWFYLGMPAFGALVVVFYLMIFKPAWI